VSYPARADVSDFAKSVSLRDGLAASLAWSLKLPMAKARGFTEIIVKPLASAMGI
jgi:hypothetical protein